MKSRGSHQGMLTILRFNWPFYALAAAVMAASLAAGIFPISQAFKLAFGAAAAVSGYFIFVSLGISYLIYDRSDLYRFRWLGRALDGASVDRVVFCHSGFDESSESLKARLPCNGWVVLDHFEATRMTELSIHRARRIFPPTTDTINCRFDQWPVASGSTSVVFGLLAIHEFRAEAERSDWLAEARRCLAPAGRIIVAEHLRNPANFLAFGPGFLHFHSRESWQRCWESAGLLSIDEFPLTPWIRIFVLTAS